MSNSFIIFFSQTSLFRWPIFLVYDPHKPVLLDLFLYSDRIICSTVIFRPLGKSNGVDLSVTTDFLSNSKGDAPFHRTTFDYFHWDGLRDQRKMFR